MSDDGPARPSDPDPSHDAGKRTDVIKGRAETFECICQMLRDGFPPWELTRKTARSYIMEGRQNDTVHDTGRRRVSDLMVQVFKAGKWTPEVHFDLLEPLLGADGKQRKFDGAGIIKLTGKGEWWRDHPEVRDWKWPHHWDGIEIPMP